MTIYCLPLLDDDGNPDRNSIQMEALIGLLAKTDPNISYQAALRIDAPEDMHGLLTRLGAERMTIVPADAPADRTSKKIRRSKPPAPQPLQTSGPVELKTCAQCGRSGLLVLTKDGICRVCAMNNARKAKADEPINPSNPPAEPVQTSETPAAESPVQGEQSFSPGKRLDWNEPKVLTEDRAQNQRFPIRHQTPIRARKLG